MQKVELLSRIDAEKAREDLDEARATLAQLKETFDLKRKAAQASIRILEIQRDRTRETMLHAQTNAALMQIRSPIDGIVVFNTIWKQGNMGEVQEGDQVRPGVPFMQVVDPVGHAGACAGEPGGSDCVESGADGARASRCLSRPGVRRPGLSRSIPWASGEISPPSCAPFPRCSRFREATPG